MRTTSTAKTLTFIHGYRNRPGSFGATRGAIETALEVEFRSVENLLRSMDDLAFYWKVRRTPR